MIDLKAAPEMHLFEDFQKKAILPEKRAQPLQRTGGGTAFFLFLVLNAAMFVKPQEIFASWGDVPVYLILILICLVFSIPQIIKRENLEVLFGLPASLCVLLLLPAVVMSHLSHFALYEARINSYEFSKIIVYFVLFVSLVNTPTRLNIFTKCFVGFALAITVLGLLHYFEYIELNVETKLFEERIFDETNGNFVSVRRLAGLGFFNDPNDLCFALISAAFLTLFLSFSAGNWAVKTFWLLPLPVFGYAFAMTQSRGGLLGAVGGIVVFLLLRFKPRKGAVLVALVIPLMLLVLGGRQTDINPINDTGLERIGLWREAFTFIKESPVFGIGYGEFVDRIGYVVHNSFLQCFVELGMMGGMAFLGSFYFNLVYLWVSANEIKPFGERKDGQLFKPYLTAILVASFISLFSITRSYSNPTYIVIGMCVSYVGILQNQSFTIFKPIKNHLVHLVGASISLLFVIYLIMKISPS